MCCFPVDDFFNYLRLQHLSPGLKRAENMYNMRPLKHTAYVWQNSKKQKTKQQQGHPLKKKKKKSLNLSLGSINLH